MLDLLRPLGLWRLFKGLWIMEAVLTQATATSEDLGLGSHAHELLTESMSWMDMHYDADMGYLYSPGGTSALRHDPRISVWYSLGLLARNKHDDVARAERIIDNIASIQYTVESEQWFGDIRKEPGEPYINSSAYPAVIYKSWDPNIRGFFGTTFVMAMEEYPHLLSDKAKKQIVETLRLAAIGDSYRVGGVDDDNLYPAYSNPSIMRAFTTGWTGRRIGDANMTAAGEEYAQEIVDLFNKHNTLSEFNSGTYTGISLFGLNLWDKYMPENSTMKQNAPKMVQSTWESVAQLWHPDMKNMAGPWDRSYGFDMNRYFSLMGAWFWTILGKKKSSIISKPQVMSHSGDFAWGPMIAILAKHNMKLMPKDIIPKLCTFQGEHMFSALAEYPPYDLEPRNITTWMSKDLTIGAESFSENVIGGPARNQITFSPAVVQWNTGDEISFISLYASEYTLQAKVSPNKLDLSYPNGTADSIFTFKVGTMRKKNTVKTWSDLVGLSVNVSGNVDMKYSLSFAGQNGGADETTNDFEHWNFTYTMPKDFTGVPQINLKLTPVPC